jgi:hypothetical protein
MKTRLCAALAAAGGMFLSGCASQMISDVNDAFGNPTRVASNDQPPPTQGPYISGPMGASMNPPAQFPNPYAANIGPSLK